MDDDAVPLRAAGRSAAAVPDRVLASWQRSEDYGVSLDEVEPVFSGTATPDSLFRSCGSEVLAGLHRTLLSEPVSLMLTDDAGLVLDRFSGDTSLLRSLDAVHLAPGFAFSEREAGTNGLGLALADRLPSVVRAEEHYSTSLCTYTCAAVPVLDPVTGRLEGAVNITTWSRSSSDLLLALAQSAAGNTAALMLARSRGRAARPAPRGEVFRVQAARLEPGSGSLQSLSTAWTDAVAEAEAAMRDGRVVAAVGERGAGRATLLAQAQRRARPRHRILSASPPAPQDVEAWLSLWTPELGKSATAVVMCEVDTLPSVTADHLRRLLDGARLSLRDLVPPRDGPVDFPHSFTAEDLASVPASLASTVEAVVHVPPLRERTDDVMPLVRHVARRVRGRDVDVTAAATRALEGHDWPGNVDELEQVVRRAVGRTDVVDVQHLPAEVVDGSGHRFTRIETLERDEIVRSLSRPGTTMKAAAEELGMSRATIYRKVAHYGIKISRG
ncbi:GAF domain-containing protein [Solicola sp. PLA-1-18]|uniref:GAF domain-containing protein n=1 Tax=Solicola sp. PLA-1-18 TaxID=3380532 RepID=UPI003B7F9EB6